jgi:hypothetical protein
MKHFARQLPAIFWVALLLFFSACVKTPEKASLAAESTPEPAAEKAKPLSRPFRDYWYSGTAEVSSYALSQARYGELREGHVVLVYVTEPFNPSEQVKADRPDSTSVSVLKLNRVRNFLTGIYPYSIMSSIFYPVGDNDHALKVSTSVQEWCGHVYAQLNNRGRFEIDSYSYFEQEGDRHLSLPKNTLEDELWARLRIDPERLPIGKDSVIPSLEYLRLRHQPLRPYEANLTLSEPGAQRTYTITYPELNRTLQLHFEGTFPYTIQGWTETYPSGFGPGAPVLTSTAHLIRKLNTAYWRQNSNKDVFLRDSLGI